MKSESGSRGGSTRNRLRRIKRTIGYITKFWQIKAILILIVLTNVIENFSPAIIGSVVDTIKVSVEGTSIVEKDGMEGLVYRILSPASSWVSQIFNMDPKIASIGVFSLSLIFVAFVSGFMNYLQRYFSAYVSQKASFDLRNDLYNSLLNQSFSFYDKQRTGQLMSRATGDIRQIERFFNFGIRMVVSTSFVLILVIYSLITINFELTIFALLLIPITVFPVGRFANRIGPLWRKIRQQFGDITSVLQENLMGLRVVRGFAMEDFEETKFRDECRKYFEINIDAGKIRAFYMPLAGTIMALGGVFIIWYGGNQVISGALTLGSIVAFYFYVARLNRPIRTIGMMVSMVQRAMAAADRVFEIIDAEVDVSDKEDALELDSIEGWIVFEDVSFAYDGKNMVLKDINLDVLPGKTFAILGATGSGKSSIINLIPRFYDVSKGKISIDGFDIRDVSIKSLRKHIGIVRQDPFLFSTTIRENISFGVKDASLEKIREAAKSAKIDDFIMSLPENYDTRVGERGVTLSGGQKQRIAIARVLLKNPKILILDASTSSVDTNTESEIQRELESLFKDRTTFIITQRLSSIRNADYILVLEDGEIIEEGIHDDLMEKNKTYYNLYLTQISEVNE